MEQDSSKMKHRDDKVVPMKSRKQELQAAISILLSVAQLLFLHVFPPSIQA